MKRGSTLFLKTAVFLIGLVVLAALVWFPKTEGRAVNLDLVEIYSDPFIIFIYIASFPFFMALYQAFELLGLVEKNKVFSETAVKALGKIKYCALATIGFIILALLFIRFIAYSGDPTVDDPAGPTMIGFIAIFSSAVIATAAGVSQKLLQNAVDLKSENDLTV